MLYNSPYPHHAFRNGQTCKLIKKTVYCEEYKPMYVIKFGDGEKEFARPEELYSDDGRYFIMGFGPSHYDWLEKNFVDFAKSLKNNNLLPHDEPTYLYALIGAHGDKCYSHKSKWEEAGIPFEYGAAIFLIARSRSYKGKVSDEDGILIRIEEWVIDNYDHFYNYLPPLDNV